LLARARAVMLTNYAEVARHFGLDPYAMLGRAGLHPSALRDPENWLPASRILSLLEESAIQSGRDDFSVVLGECRTFASLGPVSLLLRHEATLRDIVNAALEYRRLINELFHVNIRDDGRSAVLEWTLIPGLRGTQAINLLATIAYRVLVDGARCNWQPDCLHFRHSCPENVATFRRIFRCSLEFDSTFDGISCSSESLDAPNEFADRDLSFHARRLLNLMPGVRHDDTMSERVRSTIPFLLSDGKAHAEGVAECLGVPLRTLQRRLISEGQPFSELLNEARRELAIRYLGNSNQSVTAVAQLTGYSALSSFTRWFVSEFGMSPRQWRRLMRQRDALHLQSPREPIESLGFYRIQRFGGLGTVTAAEGFKADDDATAMAEAYRRANGSRATLWRGRERLAEIEPSPPCKPAAGAPAKLDAI
jgi:AraC-like DNA-binding protein